MTNLVIPVGLPGCGKSTWAKNFFDLKYAIVSSDSIREELFGSLVAAHAGDGTKEFNPQQKAENNTRVFEIFHEKIEEALKHGVDVYADATNLNQRSRQRLVDIANKAHARTHLIVFKNSDEALMRNKLRPVDKMVPDEVMAGFILKAQTTYIEIATEKYDTVTVISSVK
jgi:predicted kinase